MKNFTDPSSEIAGSIYGEGGRFPLVLLHSLAMDRRMWEPRVLDLYADDREVVIVDLPGHGHSPLKDSTTVEAIADRVAVLLSSLGIERAYVVGASMGGTVAQAVAIQHTGLVHALGLVDTTSAYHTPDAWRERAQKARDEGFASLADFQATRWFTPEFIAEHPEQLARLLGIFTEMDIDDYEAICAALGAVDLTDRLSLISAPTAIVVGSADYATPPSHATTLAERIPGSSLQVIEGLSHLGVVEAPEAIHGAIAHVL